MTEPANSFSFSFESVDQLAEMVIWDLDFRQLDAGKLRGHATVAQLPSMTWYNTVWDRRFHQRGSQPPDGLTFGFVNGDSLGRWAGVDVGANDLLNFNSRSGYENSSYSSLSATTLTVNQNHLMHEMIALGLNCGEGFSAESVRPHPTDSRRLARLRISIREVEKLLAQHQSRPLEPLAATELEQEIYLLLAECLAHKFDVPSVPLRHRTLALRRAVAFIEAHAKKPLRISDICRASLSSQRTLERAFQEEFGLTPKQYVRAIKLSCVQEELIRQGPMAKVGEIAQHWGFWHLGQFDRDYRHQFGELPSETRNRRTSRPD